MGPGTVYSRQREHAVPSRLAKPMTLESDGVRDEPGGIRSYFRSPRRLACGIKEHLTRLSSGVSLVNSSPAKNRYNLRSDSVKLLREKPFLATLDAFELWCWRIMGGLPFSLGVKTATMSCLLLSVHGGVLLQDSASDM